MNTTLVEQVMSSSTHSVFPTAQLEMRYKGKTVFSQSYGHLDPETKQRPTQPDTLFDLASVTKLFVTTTFMTLVEEKKVSLDQSVHSVLPDFTGVRPIQPYEDPLKWGSFVSVSDEEGTIDTATITFRHLLIHNSGLPAWRPLFQQLDAAAAKRLALATHFSYRTGTKVVYSDIGLIFLGMAIEKLAKQNLDEVVYTRVTKPLNLAHTRYLPVSQQPAASAQPLNIAPTEFDNQWRHRRMLGEVHDENAHRLGGISGHAGLFANATDLATFGQSYLSRTLLRADTIQEMTRMQAQFNTTRRGIGFLLWSADPEASSHPFSQSTYGHTGFTGTSLWIDPERELVVACLTNEVYNGRENRGLAQFRVQIHQAIVEAIKD